MYGPTSARLEDSSLLLVPQAASLVSPTHSLLGKLWKPVLSLLYSMEQRTGCWMKPVWELLESFQAKIDHRILKLFMFHSQLSVCIGLSWPSITSRILKQKLSFLCRLLTSNDDSIATRTFNTFVSQNAYNLSLVKLCIFLDSKLKTNFTAARDRGQFWTNISQSFSNY